MLLPTFGIISMVILFSSNLSNVLGNPCTQITVNGAIGAGGTGGDGGVGVEVYGREVLGSAEVTDELVGFLGVFRVLVKGVDDGAAGGAIGFEGCLVGF